MITWAQLLVAFAVRNGFEDGDLQEGKVHKAAPFKSEGGIFLLSFVTRTFQANSF
jgi:hypothetical protein